MNIDYSLPCRESNYRKGNAGRDFIVIHYTGNDNTTAWQNAHYFHESKVEASAHYFIDNDSCFASVPEGDTAWSVGVNYGNAPYMNICKNNNSINIELCTFDGAIQSPTVDKAVELTRHLMDKYGIPLDHVVRHYDVCRKICPAPWVGEGDILWNFFRIMVANRDGSVVTPAPSVELTPQGQQARQINDFAVACGQQCANNFIGSDFLIPDGVVGDKTRKMAIRVLQHAMNLNYHDGYVNNSLKVKLSEDGVYGPKTNAALSGHYVEKGERQYMVTALEIYMYLFSKDPKGVEYPGKYGDGLAAAVTQERVDSNGFKFILGLLGCDLGGL